jgi:hypothetical protein
MPYYIRKGNSVYKDTDLSIGNRWSAITPETNRLVVSEITTLIDAQIHLKLIGEVEAKVSNNLDYNGV